MAMVEQAGPLSLSRQCQLLGLNRAALYYQAAPVDAYELAADGAAGTASTCALRFTGRGG